LPFQYLPWYQHNKRCGATNLLKITSATHTLSEFAILLTHKIPPEKKDRLIIIAYFYLCQGFYILKAKTYV